VWFYTPESLNLHLVCATARVEIGFVIRLLMDYVISSNQMGVPC
jgi:hypothetical protein